MDTEQELHKARFYLNMGRISGLIKLVVGDGGPPQPPAMAIDNDCVRADLNRAIVVFLHATFEDALRTAARQRLRAAKSDALKNIPLVGATRSGRSEKFSLDALDAHRGKTVDQLIFESVQNYLDTKSFSSCGEIEAVLIQMELDTEPFKPIYSDLQGLMNRRHRIVHQADLPNAEDRVSPPWTFGDNFLLAQWMLAVMTFHALLCVSINPADEVQRWNFGRCMKAIELGRKARADLVAVPKHPPELLVAGFQRMLEQLTEIVACLRPPSDEVKLAIWNKMKPPDDDTTEDQVIVELSGQRDNEAG